MCVSLEKNFKFPLRVELASSAVVSLPELNANIDVVGFLDSLFTRKPLFGNIELE